MGFSGAAGTFRRSPTLNRQSATSSGAQRTSVTGGADHQAAGGDHSVTVRPGGEVVVVRDLGAGGVEEPLLQESSAEESPGSSGSLQKRLEFACGEGEGTCHAGSGRGQPAWGVYL